MRSSADGAPSVQPVERGGVGVSQDTCHCCHRSKSAGSVDC